jgi:hypothetical protein
MTFTTIIPKYRNDKKKVARTELDEILDTLVDQFGGITGEGETVGEWIDPENGLRYKDKGVKVTVACDSERLAEAEEAVRQIGRRLGQKVMYLEVRYYDGVRFLRIDSTPLQINAFRKRHEIEQEKSSSQLSIESKRIPCVRTSTRETRPVVA